MSVIHVLYIFIKLIKPYEEQELQVDADPSAKWSETILNTETLTDLKAIVEQFVASYMEVMYEVKGKSARPEIMNVKRYVCENIDQNISLEDASRLSNMSRSYFSFIFKKEIGDSYTNFINRTKMEKARELIEKQYLKVYEAAEKVGIQDEAYFSKLFKKYIGISPGKIRGKR